ncbi:MAG TPA: LysR family transcriptional regulator [Gammaproteobacteria bacterium]|nr:LysR family transcriptional regulator [Gammaproteobacteria bacterium]
MAMDLRGLRYFVAAYECGSLTGAAKRSHVSQPSISAAVEQLEAELGARLFRRHRHGVHVTAEGERLYPLALQLLDDAGAIRALFKDGTARREALTVNVLASINMVRVGAIMKELLDAHPELELRVVTGDTPADLRLTSNHALKKGETFVPVWNEGYVAAVPRHHELRLKREVTLSELLDYPLIERVSCEFHGQMMALIARSANDVRIAAKVHSEEWALALVAAGVGVALVPRTSVVEGGDVALCPLQDKLTRQVGFAYRSGSGRARQLDSWFCRHRLS